ncbi:hypothetical protein [Chelativorans xinjiangense]|uniref:hypothetical protein n=1 Tax=Chelativorans xinjiangense TaxID=2681485 RepID=UPI00135CB4CF|nr:hypothetical protein [Chelativorans xinjiangense]
MAYSTSNPPELWAGALSGGRRLWYYSSADAVTVVRVDGYFSNGWDLGMRKGDLVIVLDNDASPITGALCWVTSASATGGVDLSDGVTITGTDTD